MAKVQNDFLLTLAYLMGERTIQTSQTAQRGNFIQQTLDEIYRAYKWPFASSTVSLTVASGVASLPSNYDYQHGVEAYFYQGTVEVPLDVVESYDQVNYQTGDKRFWTDAQSDGTYLLKTKDVVDSVTVKFQTKAPVLASAATIATPFEDTMTVSLGARRYIKLSQDPNADISQDEDLFQKRLTENIAATQVGNPKRRIRFIGNANSYRIGGGYE
jgi:hypothetical protein